MKVFQNLQNIDLFGTNICIAYNKRENFNTRLGGFITLSLSVILVMYIINLINVYITHSQVQVIQEIRNQPNQNQFNLTADNFSFMVGITDLYYNQFIDPTVYNLTVKQITQQKLLNQTTGKYYTKQTINNLRLERCTENHFKIQQTQQFYLQQDYKNFLCISQDEQLQLQGVYNSEVFQQIEIEVSSCSGNNCADPAYITKKLNNCYFQVYFTDKNVKTTDLENPFKPIGRSVFYIAGTGFSKTINLYFTQNHISSDTGMIKESIQEQLDITFSSDREQVVSKNGNRLFLLQMSLDPNKEIVYTRKYLTIAQGLSQIGGIYNVLFAVGCFICMPYAQLQYKRNVMNQVFGFQYSEKGQEENDQDKSQINRNGETFDQKQKNNEIDKIQEIFKSKNLNKSLNATDRSVRQFFSQKDKENHERDLKKFFEQTFEELRIKSCDYLNYYLTLITCKKRKRSQVIDYGLQKLYGHLDIVYIMNKLIEFEKLKKLLLNESQLRLFDYIPKPIIKVDKLNNPIITNDQNQCNEGVFYEDNRTQIQKAEEAQEAYNEIVNQSQQNSALNKKLINLLHPKLIELFKSQSFDRHDSQQERSPQMPKKSQFVGQQLPYQVPLSLDSQRSPLQQPIQEKMEIQQAQSQQISCFASIKDIQIQPNNSQQNEANGQHNNNQIQQDCDISSNTVREVLGSFQINDTKRSNIDIK
ncbi:hypothetical protein ABPG74_018542 [Tetrahymena malaccensis]